MKTAAPSSVAPHNHSQRSYFERGIKSTMRPADSPYLRRHVEPSVASTWISIVSVPYSSS
jgi:hypothetical protein